VCRGIDNAGAIAAPDQGAVIERRSIVDIMEAIQARRSIRSYSPDPIPPDKESALLEALRLSPSAGNRQPWRFILVREPDLIRRLAQECSWERLAPLRALTTAQLVIVGCGVPEECVPVGSLDGDIVDVVIALQSAVLAATGLGLGTCWIGAFYEQRVKTLLSVPEEARVIALLAVGVGAESPPAKNRKEPSEVFYGDLYGAPYTGV
jgi:nitroreductase